jgi:hypothetical protein
MSDEAKEKTFQSSIGCFTELEDMLYICINNMRCANFHVLPSLTIAKAKSITLSLSILKTDFKASWQWLSQFRVRRGLQKMLLHGGGIHYYIFYLFAKGQTKNLKGLRSKNNLPYLRCNTHCN